MQYQAEPGTAIKGLADHDKRFRVGRQRAVLAKPGTAIKGLADHDKRFRVGRQRAVLAKPGTAISDLLEGKMSGEQLVANCSPTLAGLKPANLFSVKADSMDELAREIRYLNDEIRDKGVCIIPMCMKKERAVVYVYRISALKRYFHDEEVSSLLRLYGYEPERPEKCVKRLCKKMKEAAFPHEVGLFLGYPARDVYEFINRSARDCKCVGCWKVYGNEKEAIERFRAFDECTSFCKKMYQSGKTLRDLTKAG